MPLTAAQAISAREHILGTVFNQPDDSPLILSLIYGNVESIIDLIMLSEDEMATLHFVDAQGVKQFLPSELKEMLWAFSAYVAYRAYIKDPIQDNWTGVTRDDYDQFRFGPMYYALRSARFEAAANTNAVHVRPGFGATTTRTDSKKATANTNAVHDLHGLGATTTRAFSSKATVSTEASTPAHDPLGGFEMDIECANRLVPETRSSCMSRDAPYAHDVDGSGGASAGAGSKQEYDNPAEIVEDNVHDSSSMSQGMLKHIPPIHKVNLHEFSCIYDFVPASLHELRMGSEGDVNDPPPAMQDTYDFALANLHDLCMGSEGDVDNTLRDTEDPDGSLIASMLWRMKKLPYANDPPPVMQDTDDYAFIPASLHDLCMGSEGDVDDTLKDTEDPDGYLIAYGPVPMNLHYLCLGSGGSVDNSLPAMWECLRPFLHISCTESL